MSENIVSSPNNTPYVVSADAAGLLERWTGANGYGIPSQAYFDDLSVDLGANLEETTGLDVEIVSEEEMREGMDRLVRSSPYPVISLDRAYFDNGNPVISGYIDVTRAVKENMDGQGNMAFVSAGALMPRPGFPTLKEQLEAFRSSEPSPITLVDDVIFSGEGAVDLVKQLESVGRPVAKIIAGIGIREGIAKLEDLGIEVECVRTYTDVADEVCQRDFLAGVPMSGRTVLGENGNSWSAPYFLPYGDPEGWASIPAERCRVFSRYCLQQSVDLWAEIEAVSGRQVAAAAIPRALRGANDQGSVTILLRQHLDRV